MTATSSGSCYGSPRILVDGVPLNICVLKPKEETIVEPSTTVTDSSLLKEDTITTESCSININEPVVTSNIDKPQGQGFKKFTLGIPGQIPNNQIAKHNDDLKQQKKDSNNKNEIKLHTILSSKENNFLEQVSDTDYINTTNELYQRISDMDKSVKPQSVQRFPIPKAKQSLRSQTVTCSNKLSEMDSLTDFVVPVHLLQSNLKKKNNSVLSAKKKSVSLQNENTHNIIPTTGSKSHVVFNDAPDVQLIPLGSEMFTFNTTITKKTKFKGDDDSVENSQWKFSQLQQHPEFQNVSDSYKTILLKQVFESPNKSFNKKDVLSHRHNRYLTNYEPVEPVELTQHHAVQYSQTKQIPQLYQEEYADNLKKKTDFLNYSSYNPKLIRKKTSKYSHLLDTQQYTTSPKTVQTPLKVQLPQTQFDIHDLMTHRKQKCDFPASKWHNYQEVNLSQKEQPLYKTPCIIPPKPKYSQSKNIFPLDKELCTPYYPQPIRSNNYQPMIPNNPPHPYIPNYPILSHHLPNLNKQPHIQQITSPVMGIHTGKPKGIPTNPKKKFKEHNAQLGKPSIPNQQKKFSTIKPDQQNLKHPLIPTYPTLKQPKINDNRNLKSPILHQYTNTKKPIIPGYLNQKQPLPTTGYPSPKQPPPTTGYPSPKQPFPTTGYPSPKQHFPTTGYPSPKQPFPTTGYPSPKQPLPTTGYPSPKQPLPTTGYPSPKQPLPTTGYPSPKQPLPTTGYPSPKQPLPTTGYPSPKQPLPTTGYPSPKQPLPTGYQNFQKQAGTPQRFPMQQDIPIKVERPVPPRFGKWLV